MHRGGFGIVSISRALHNRMLVLKRYALAREILRGAQDDGKKTSGARVILSEGCSSEESRRMLRRPALVTHSSPIRE